jgi:hypothetical protein
MSNARDDKHDEQKIVCHAPGDRCHGCDHYKGKAPVCSFAPSAGGEPAAYIEHHKGGDNLVWEQTAIPCTPLYKQTVSATLPTKAVVTERIEAYLKRVEQLGGETGNVNAAYLAQWVLDGVAQPTDSRGDSDA